MKKIVVVFIVFIPIAVIVMIRYDNDVLTTVMGLVIFWLVLRLRNMFDPARQERFNRKRPTWDILDNSRSNSVREAMFLADVKNIANSSRIQNETNVHSNGGEDTSLSTHGQSEPASDTQGQVPNKSMPYSYMNKAPKVQQNGGTKVSLSKESYGQKETVENSADPRRRIDKSMPYSYMNGGTGMPVSQGVTREDRFISDITDIANRKYAEKNSQGFSNSAADIFAQSKTQRERLFLADINEIANSRGSGSKYSSYSSSGTGMNRNSGTTREAQFFADINEIANRKRAQNKQNSFTDDSLTADNNKDTQDF